MSEPDDWQTIRATLSILVDIANNPERTEEQIALFVSETEEVLQVAVQYVPEPSRPRVSQLHTSLIYMLAVFSGVRLHSLRN